MKFQRTISPLGLLLAGIGSVIGSGWLFGPLYAAQIAGPGAILSWLIGGILMIVIALTFAELGSAFPVAGGMIQFAQYSHGPLISFMIGWMVWVSSVAIAPVETLGMIQYLANYIPGLMVSVNSTHVLTYQGMGVAAFVMLVMCVLNCYGAQFFSRSNMVITLVKLIVPMVTIVILMGVSFHSHAFVSEAHGGFLPMGWHGVFAALPLGGVIYSFIGSNTVLQLAGETKNPQRSIPLALIGSMIFCIILYSLLQIAFIGALPESSLANGWGALHFVGDTGPFAGMFAALGFSWVVLMIYADALVSPFGTGYVFTASTARIGYGLSQIGFLPASLTQLSKKGVPLRSIALNYFIGLLLFLPFPAWQKLAGFIVSCFIVSYIIGPIALIGLRVTHPQVPRPFRLPFGRFVSFIAFYICNLLIFWTGWNIVSKMMIALALGFVFFLIYCLREQKHQIHEQRYAALWAVPYCLSMALVSYAGTFGGGKNWLPFGLDFIAIAGLTAVIFLLVLQKRSNDHAQNN